MAVTDDTIIRLLVRRGSNADRKRIVLASGELGMAVEPVGQERLFCGTTDTNCIGGIPAGLYYHGDQVDFDLTNLGHLYPGDFMKLTSGGTILKPLGLYTLKPGQPGFDSDDWDFLGTKIGLDGTLEYDGDGNLRVNVSGLFENGEGFTVLPAKNVFGTGTTTKILQFDKNFISLSADNVGAGHFVIGNNPSNVFDKNYRMQLTGNLKVNNEITVDGIPAVPGRIAWQISGVEVNTMYGNVSGVGINLGNPLDIQTTLHLERARAVTAVDSKRYVQYINGSTSNDGGLLIRAGDTDGDQFGLKIVNAAGATLFHSETTTGNVYTKGTISSEGDITSKADVIAYGSVVTPSDKTLKKNIKPLKDSLDKILKISGVTYDWKNKNTIGIKSDTRQVGVIAQEVELVLPEAVKEYKGIKTVDYSKLVPLLIESIKDLNKKVEQYGNS